MPDEKQVASDYYKRDQCTPAVDGQAIPGDDLNAQSTDAIQQRSKENANDAGIATDQYLALSAHKNTPCPEGQRANKRGTTSVHRVFTGTVSESLKDSGAVPGAPVLSY